MAVPHGTARIFMNLVVGGGDGGGSNGAEAEEYFAHHRPQTSQKPEEGVWK